MIGKNYGTDLKIICDLHEIQSRLYLHEKKRYLMPPSTADHMAFVLYAYRG